MARSGKWQPIQTAPKDEVADLLGGCLTWLGEFADVADHDREPLAVGASVGALDGHVQGEQIRLVAEIQQTVNILSVICAWHRRMPPHAPALGECTDREAERFQSRPRHFRRPVCGCGECPSSPKHPESQPRRRPFPCVHALVYSTCRLTVAPGSWAGRRRATVHRSSHGLPQFRRLAQLRSRFGSINSAADLGPADGDAVYRDRSLCADPGRGAMASERARPRMSESQFPIGRLLKSSNPS